MTEEPSPASTVTPGGIISCPDSNTRTMARKGKLRSPSTATSGAENCNPNVSLGSCKRKISNYPKSSAAEQLHESINAPKHLSGQACAEFNLISPPRKHACSSRRCASKNPDYAAPATVNPKKFLKSKRHALPPQEVTSCCKCSVQESKGGASDAGSNMKPCNRCCNGSHPRRWSADDSGSTHLTENGESVEFSLPSSEPHCKDAIHSSDSGQQCAFRQAFANATVHLPVAETAHQESARDIFKSWSHPNELSNLQACRVDTQDNHLITGNSVECITSVMELARDSVTQSFDCHSLLYGCCDSEPKHPAGSSNKPEAEALPIPGKKRLSSEACSLNESYLATEDGGCSGLMPEEEDAAGASPSPEKTGNWRLNAVLETFENLSPTREGRVKTLVRAFESLMSFTEGQSEQPTRKRLGQFSYLSSNVNMIRGEKFQKEYTSDGGGGGDGEDASDAEEEGDEQQWQELGTSQLSAQLSEENEENYGIGGRWHKEEEEREYAKAVLEDEERYRMGEQWNRQETEQRFDQSNDAGVDEKEMDGTEKVLQKQEAQRVSAQSDENDELEEKQHDEQLAERVYAQTVEEDEDGKQPQDQTAGNESFEGDEDNKGKHHDEQLVECVYAQRGEEDEDGKQAQEQASGNVSTGSFEEGSIEEGSGEDDQSERHVSALPAKSIKAPFERQPFDQEICMGSQQNLLQKSMDGYFTSTAARKKPSSRNRKPLQGSNRSVSSTRRPLAQKRQTQPVQEKPRLSKPQPFNLLTEARGHMKEQEFLMRLRRILEEEEKLRVPLAQGLPWTTDEPEVPYKPPVKENTRPLDIHLNSDLRAMERAEFDRFIAEKLLYIEERRMEEERLRRIAEEEEIKRMRQEMVPKAQLMPYFDRPFRPRRSSKHPTIPKEPQFQHNKQPKRQKCVASST